MNLKRSILKATFFLAALVASLTLTSPARAQSVSVRFSGKFTLTSPVRWGNATLPPGTYSLSIDSISRPVMATIRNENSTVAIRVMSIASFYGQSGSDFLRLKVRDGSLVVQSLVLADLNTVLIYDPSPVRENVQEARADSTVVFMARK